MNGFQLPAWRRHEYQLASTLRSLESVGELSPNFIGIIVAQYQENIDSTAVEREERTASDEDLRFIIATAHQLGYSAMLMPHVNLSRDPTHWHGQIGLNFTEGQWRAWFDSYRLMIYHYASLAEDSGTELFVAGNEFLLASLTRPADWLDTIAGIRARYSGPVTYAAHPVEFGTISWWSEVDLLGLNPYYKLAAIRSPTLDQLRSSWKTIVTDIELTVSRWNKMVVFPEVGYPSVIGASVEPWNFDLITDPGVPVDVEEQAICVQSLYEAFWAKSWWYGVSWWHWNINPDVGGMNDKNYTPKGKPAAGIIRAYSTSDLAGRYLPGEGT